MALCALTKAFVRALGHFTSILGTQCSIRLHSPFRPLRSTDKNGRATARIASAEGSKKRGSTVKEGSIHSFRGKLRKAEDLHAVGTYVSCLDSLMIP